MSDLSREQIRNLARAGALARLQELKNEEAAIRREFPELSSKTLRAAVSDAEDEQAVAASPARRPKMSAAARRAVSVRMKKYWAERRRLAGKK